MKHTITLNTQEKSFIWDALNYYTDACLTSQRRMDTTSTSKDNYVRTSMRSSSNNTY